MLQRLRNRERIEAPRIRHAGPLSPRVPSRRSERNDREQRRTLSADARSFVPNSSGSDANLNSHLTPHQQQLGERLYPKVFKLTFVHLMLFIFIYLLFSVSFWFIGCSNSTKFGW